MMETISVSLIAQGAFVLVLLFCLIMTFVLFYHWVRYNVGMGSTLLVMGVYSFGTAVILLSLVGVLAQLV